MANMMGLMVLAGPRYSGLVMKRLDPLSPEERSERMRRVRRQDTKPEMRVRKLVHGLGYRYRLHDSRLPGKPDLVFTGRKKVIFVHGCYWHRHDCKSGRRLPKTRLEFWRPKLESNAERDKRNLKQLEEMGWKALVIWECETNDKEVLAMKIRQFLGDSS